MQARKHKIFCSFFGQGAPKSDRKAKFQNLQQTVAKRSLNFVEDGRSLYGMDAIMSSYFSPLNNNNVNGIN
jgi:hypothetical protein